MMRRREAMRTLGAALALASASACATDLLIGEETDAASTTMAPESTTGDPMQTSAMPTGDTDAPSSTTSGVDPGDTSTTTGAGNDTEPEPTMSTDTTEGQAEAGGSTTGEPQGCRAILDMEPCMLEDGCTWSGDAKQGECLVDPCFEPTECVELTYELCADALACAWNSENPKIGDCLPLQCVPCNLLTQPECMEIRGCMWDELEMACFEVV